MAISSYDYVPNQSITDTYVPLPFKEMQEALNAKQAEYDKNLSITQSADNEIQKLEVPEAIRVSDYRSPNGYIANTQANILNAKKAEFQKKKNDIFEKYSNDFTSSEAQKEIRNYVTEASTWYNTEGKQIQQDAEEIKKHNTYYDEYLKDAKNSDYQGNTLLTDNNVEEFIRTGKDFKSIGINKYVDYSEGIKDALTPIKSEVMSEEIIDGIKTYKDAQGNPIYALKNGKRILKGIGEEKIENAVRNKIESAYAGNINNTVEQLIRKDLRNGTLKISDFKNSDGSDVMVTIKQPVERDKKGNLIYKDIEVTAYQKYANEQREKIIKPLVNYAKAVFEQSDVDLSQNVSTPSFMQIGTPDSRYGLPPQVVPAKLKSDSDANPAEQNSPGRWGVSFDTLKKEIGVVLNNSLKSPTVALNSGPVIVGILGKFVNNLAADKDSDELTKEGKEQYDRLLEEGILSTIEDPVKKEVAKELLKNNGVWTGNGTTYGEYKADVIKAFGDKWKNVVTDYAVTPLFSSNTEQYRKNLGGLVKTFITDGYGITDNKGIATNLNDDESIDGGSSIIFGEGNTVSLSFNTDKNRNLNVDISGNNAAGRAAQERYNILSGSYKQPQPIDNSQIVYGILQNKIKKGLNFTEGNTKVDLFEKDGTAKKGVTYEVVVDMNDPHFKSIVFKKDGKVLKHNGDVDEFGSNEINTFTATVLGNYIGLSGNQPINYAKGKGYTPIE